eukprot:CAMPEP_0194512906 /NCGR_PEP_ID=MMETSP0253-20130528/45054_1 /TAXON_ID=2966 /ORGANISM="Noctiluca scintillans" /LENGTH=46 /DNA_ID= /DNA_START= /DNA_END= /DNA_ORIENTATION=
MKVVGECMCSHGDESTMNDLFFDIQTFAMQNLTPLQRLLNCLGAVI